MTEPTALRRRLGGFALIAAPLVLLVAKILHPAESADLATQLATIATYSTSWYAAHLLFILGFAVFVPAVLALGHRMRHTAPTVEVVGTGLAVLGAVLTSCLIAIEGIGGGELAQLTDRAGAVAAFERLTTDAGTVLPFALLGLTLEIGLIVLAIGMARSACPRWQPWTLAASAVALVLGTAAGVEPAFYLGLIGLLLVFAGTGFDDLRAGRPVSSAASAG